jgi:hypothetical protein
VTADIFKLNDYRSTDIADDEIDLVTTVDAAIRDLREILRYWGSEGARHRAEECQLMLRRTFSKTVICKSGSLF